MGQANAPGWVQGVGGEGDTRQLIVKECRPTGYAKKFLNCSQGIEERVLFIERYYFLESSLLFWKCDLCLLLLIMVHTEYLNLKILFGYGQKVNNLCFFTAFMEQIVTKHYSGEDFKFVESLPIVLKYDRILLFGSFCREFVLDTFLTIFRN